MRTRQIKGLGDAAAHLGPVGQDEEARSTTADHGGVRLREEEEAGEEDNDGEVDGLGDPWAGKMSERK